MGSPYNGSSRVRPITLTNTCPNIAVPDVTCPAVSSNPGVWDSKPWMLSLTVPLPRNTNLMRTSLLHVI